MVDCLAWAETADSYSSLSVHTEDARRLKCFPKAGVVNGASDPELPAKVVGKAVKETQKVYSQRVAVLGQDRWERLEKMKDETKNVVNKFKLAKS